MGPKRFNNNKRRFGAAAGDEDETNMQSVLEIDLGHKKRLHVREFKGTTLVDIREYYTKADAPDTWLPGKKGISLSVDVWNEVVKNIEKVNEAIGKIEPAKKAKVDDEEAEEKHEDEEE